MVPRFLVYTAVLTAALLSLNSLCYARPVGTIVKIPRPDGLTIFAFEQEIEEVNVTVNCNEAYGDGHDIVRTLTCDDVQIACDAAAGWSCEANQNGNGYSCSC